MDIATDPRSAAAPAGGRSALPGLMLALVGAMVGLGINQLEPSLSSHVVAVILGAVAANAGMVGVRLRPGLRVAARSVLRAGIVLLGFRLSISDVRALGVQMLAAVVVVVVVTFFGTRWLGQRLGLSSSLSLLVATGYSICGASAIAAAEPFADATEEEVAYAIALVTLCGSLAIGVLPPLGSMFGLSDHTFGLWVGSSVHDVGQVVAAGSARSSLALEAAIIVKLTRVALLAPLLMGVAISARRRTGSDRSPRADGAAAPRPPLLPLFVVLFVVAVTIRSVSDIPQGGLDGIKVLETALLGAGLFGLGAGVDVGRLRKLGGRPLALGLVSWVLIAGTSLAAVSVIG